MRKTLLLCAALLLTAHTATAQEANDINTPLHLMQPDYGFAYGVPKGEEVKADIDRVLNFLEEAMPAKTEGGKLAQGGFRMSSYEMGVLYSAVQDAATVTGDARYARFCQDRLGLMASLRTELYDKLKADRNYDRQMRSVAFPGSLDESGAMCAAYCREQIVRPDKAYKGTIRNYMNRVWKTYRQGGDKIIARNRPYPNSVWLDDMYMGIVPLAWYGRLTGDTASLGETVRQVKAFKSRMWVEEKQLFRHGWVEEMQPHPFFPWGRANGWAILTLCQVLDAMGDGPTPDREFVLDLLRQHVEGLCAVQDKTGYWHQLLDDPSTYQETSATAIFAYCLAHAICEGWLDAKAYGPRALLAWNATARQINAKGQVENVCVGTGMGFDRALYAYRPTHIMAAHGYGPVIWAGSETLRLLQRYKPVMHDSAVLFK